MLQDHKKEMESEFARVSREGGDASNLSVAVTRAFGDVDERFGKLPLFLVLECLGLLHACRLPSGVFLYYCMLILDGQWQKRARPQRGALRFELHYCADFNASFNVSAVASPVLV